MKRYSPEKINRAKYLRSLGLTYSEIRQNLKLQIPKSTLSEWCKNIPLPQIYNERIAHLNTNNLNRGRLIALEINRIKRKKYLEKIKKKNTPIANDIKDMNIAKTALAMLCLGEASKYSSKRRSFSLGSSDPRIITIFLELLKNCFNYDPEKIRCTVQCRADQDIESLKKFWMKVTKIPERLFYKAQVDPRTIGKPTIKKDYKGVLRIDYFDIRAQLELESLADLVYNKLSEGPEV